MKITMLQSNMFHSGLSTSLEIGNCELFISKNMRMALTCRST